MVQDKVEPMTMHYYRKIKVMTNDKKRLAVFYHYFGTCLHNAETAHPRILPGRRQFKPIKPW